MLWYKGWLETRLRFLFCFALSAFILYMSHQHGAPRSLHGIIQGTTPSAVLAFCAMLGGAGIVTQPPFQAVKGLHGSTLFTLSLPVSRLRLVAVRATIGWLELASLITLFCTGLWFLYPSLKSTTPFAEMGEYIVTLIACASVIYCFSVLLATFFEDQWRIWGTMIGAVGLWWLFHSAHVPASIDIFQAIDAHSPLIAHTMPWPALALAAVLSAAFLITALKIAQSREY